MPRRTSAPDPAIAAFLRELERVATHAQLKTLGVPPSTISWRIRPDGPWQRALPGVVIAHRGTPTRREHLLAAVRYGGEGTVVTGMSALREYGVRAARTSDSVHILIGHSKQRTSHFFVTVERTGRMPSPRMQNGIPIAAIPRAVIDACRRCADLDTVREIVAEVVQRGMCTPNDILHELRAAARQRTALTRAAMSEIAEGIRSVAEAKAKDALRKAGIPPPEWNVSLFTANGEFIGSPDAYWEDLVVAVQIDSMAFHLSPADYRKTQQRQREFMAHGVLVLPVAPNDVLTDPDTFTGQVSAMRYQASKRPRPNVFVRRLAA